MAVIDQLKEINNLQFDEEGRVKIVPLSKYEYQTYPIGEEYITITQDEYIGLRVMVYQFTEDLHAVEKFVPSEFHEFLRNRKG